MAYLDFFSLDYQCGPKSYWKQSQWYCETWQEPDCCPRRTNWQVRRVHYVVLKTKENV